MQRQMRLEREHLETIKHIAEEQISDLKQQAETSEADIMAAKKEMRGETSHAIVGSLYGSEAFEQLAELSQFATQISDNISSYESIIKNIDRLEKLVQSPYFARIDFTFPEESMPKPIYIGRSSLKQRNNILIHDWRAPIAGMFYRFSMGPAYYDAPVGRIAGEISLKRQYEIKEGRLEYYFDADIEILDEYLRKLLSQNASPHMRSIVETIQREQDVVIRDADNDVLIVQGVAGSGKTSIALHRIAYLMYSGLGEGLSNQSIAIISPNNLFERYISNVLPELGEQNVHSFILEELFDDILGIPNMQTRFQLVEQLMVNEAYWVGTMKDSLAFKCSASFTAILDALDFSGGDLAEILTAYSGLFEQGVLEEAARKAGVALPENIEDIISFTKENLRSSRLFFDDAGALAYLHLRENGWEQYAHIRLVVVDEAQDYYHLHYRIFKLLFPAARLTMLGDINQTIEKHEDMGFYQDVLAIFCKKRSSLVTLEKSFRCTNEIIRFASGIAGQDIAAFGRDGENPTITRLKDEHDVDALIGDARKCLDEGYKSVGIICKSERDCHVLYEKLKGRMHISLLDGASGGELAGAFILPLYLSKGLEFDAAFIWGADDMRFGGEGDKSLLFIGCTRALHCLSLYYWGNPSPHLPLGNP